MVNSLTHSLLTTGLIVGAAHWSTLSIATNVCGWTVSISVATYVLTSNLWITFIAEFAGADRVLLYNLTVGIDATLAGVFTEAVKASLV